MKSEPEYDKLAHTSNAKVGLHLEYFEYYFIHCNTFLLSKDRTLICEYGPRREKTCLWQFANNTGADQPAHPSILERTVCKRPTSKISNFLLVSVAEDNGLKLALSETPNHRFCRIEAHMKAVFSQSVSQSFISITT